MYIYFTMFLEDVKQYHFNIIEYRRCSDLFWREVLDSFYLSGVISSIYSSDHKPNGCSSRVRATYANPCMLGALRKRCAQSCKANVHKVVRILFSLTSSQVAEPVYHVPQAITTPHM